MHSQLLAAFQVYKHANLLPRVVRIRMMMGVCVGVNVLSQTNGKEKNMREHEK